MADITGADLLAKSLKEQGVQFMFGVVGFPVGPLAEAAQKAGLPYIGMRNEQTASYAAGAVGLIPIRLFTSSNRLTALGSSIRS